MGKDFQRVYEAMNKKVLTEANKELDLNDPYSWPRDLRDKWPWSEEYNEWQDELDKIRIAYQKSYAQAAPLRSLSDFLERLFNKLDTPATLKIPELTINKKGKLNKDIADDTEVLYRKITDFGTEVNNAIIDAYSGLKHYKNDINALKKEVKELTEKPESTENINVLRNKEEYDKFKQIYTKKFIDKNYKPEYTTNTTTYSNLDGKDWYNVDWDINKKEEK